ncbi:GNAT family N-acetyltransferase [Spongiimicrobium sp. 2-473A-2-J]|uniref:GNAT family N-acetyltransferase n=1 Tax=Eudoraea algarum TaxID=3417568 RepID=UPI003D35C6D3
MELQFGPAKSEVELLGILKLQKANLPNAVSSDEKQREGFVTVNHTLELLGRMNSVCPHIIAKDRERVVAYTLCMHPMFASEIPVLKPMFNEIDSILPKMENYLVMGQVCIDKAYRKLGIFRTLYETMQKSTRSGFDSIVTEVDAENVRSLQAHYAVGFRDLKTYTSGGRQWHLIVLK